MIVNVSIQEYTVKRREILNYIEFAIIAILLYSALFMSIEITMFLVVILGIVFLLHGTLRSR
ncbi:MAG: hypothetical protein MUP60_00290 [Candidatus Thorarchaeota archaeon]|nr:hypothetical protein [Candidatus Thorarchaeota archaeon]